MVTRWSRLALAAILACGATPGVAAAAADEGDCALRCPCSPDQLTAPSLASLDADELDRAQGRRHAQPLCAPTTVAVVAPRVELVGDVAAPVAAGSPGPRVAPWRLAPKTSPPRR